MDGIIEVGGLTYHYKKNTLAIDNLSFSVNSGEIFGFLGPNGSGKSTTQKILTGRINEFHGRAHVFQKDLKSIGKAYLNQIGVLFEFPYMYENLSGYDNLEYFASFYNVEDIDIYGMLERLGFKMSFVKKPVSTYSKGMKQRINMARALLTNPKILFLDEPTSGLDPAGASLFREIIQKEREKGVTVFLTTHNMNDADILCDRVAFIADGKIVTVDSPESLKQIHSRKEVEVIYRKNQKIEKSVMHMETFVKSKQAYEDIVSLKTIEPTLEDVFIEQTGKGLKL